MNDLIKNILECSNIDEVKKTIDMNPKSILVKTFNYYVLILVVVPENNHYIAFKSIYFNMKSKTYTIEHHSGKYIENFEDEYLFCESNSGEFIFHFKSGFQCLKQHVSPKGDQLKIKVKNGESGGGSNWSKLALGLEPKSRI